MKGRLNWRVPTVLGESSLFASEGMGSSSISIDVWKEGGIEHGDFQTSRARDLSPPRKKLAELESKSVDGRRTRRRVEGCIVVSLGEKVLPSKSRQRPYLLAPRMKAARIGEVGRGVWGGALLLADFLVQNWQTLKTRLLDEAEKDPSRGIRVLELGSGVGLTASVFLKLLERNPSRAPPLSLFLTDADLGSLHLCKISVEINAPQENARSLDSPLQVYVRRFCWEERPPWVAEFSKAGEAGQTGLASVRATENNSSSSSSRLLVAAQTDDRDGEEDGELQSQKDFAWSSRERRELSKDRGLDFVLAADEPVDVFLEDFKDRFVCTLEQRDDLLFPESHDLGRDGENVSHDSKPRFHVYEYPAHLLTRRLFYDEKASEEETTRISGAPLSQKNWRNGEVDSRLSSEFALGNNSSESVFSITPQEAEDSRRLAVIWEVRPCHCAERDAGVSVMS